MIFSTNETDTLDNYMQKNEFGPQLHNIYKNYFKADQRALDSLGAPRRV